MAVCRLLASPLIKYFIFPGLSACNHSGVQGVLSFCILLSNLVPNIIFLITAGKINIEHVTIFLSKYISKGAADLEFSPDVGNNPSNPYIQRKQNK